MEIKTSGMKEVVTADSLPDLKGHLEKGYTIEALAKKFSCSTDTIFNKLNNEFKIKSKESEIKNEMNISCYGAFDEIREYIKHVKHINPVKQYYK
jgi:hypothetical protein